MHIQVRTPARPCHVNTPLPGSALFRSVDHAIRFAYAIEQYPIFTLSELGPDLIQCDRSERPQDAMSQHDWHAQGAMIRQRISSLPTTLRAYVIAWYGWGPQRSIALAELDSHASRYIDGIHSGLVRDLVRRYFDLGRHPESQASIAQRHQIDRSRVRWWEDKVKALFAPFDGELERQLGEAWRRDGLIE